MNDDIAKADRLIPVRCFLRIELEKNLQAHVPRDFSFVEVTNAVILDSLICRSAFVTAARFFDARLLILALFEFHNFAL
ncbi:hypothetical protein DN068_16500 [Taibaiella soli]|uniref:Uncharacterized protein n=1 Tax=Taibaiella soli TaxID=1649169 RepID=A0A2W2AVG8_9BACT|nr:hypothetical protein DN068_16500 [Taibaiella soli]